MNDILNTILSETPVAKLRRLMYEIHLQEYEILVDFLKTHTLEEYLGSSRITTEQDMHGWVARIEDFGVYGVGASREEALESLTTSYVLSMEPIKPGEE